MGSWLPAAKPMVYSWLAKESTKKYRPPSMPLPFHLEFCSRVAATGGTACSFHPLFYIASTDVVLEAGGAVWQLHFVSGWNAGGGDLTGDGLVTLIGTAAAYAHHRVAQGTQLFEGLEPKLGIAGLLAQDILASGVGWLTCEFIGVPRRRFTVGHQAFVQLAALQVGMRQLAVREV